ncbi:MULTISPECIES: exodeoxyribonuclease VII small subunit [Flammeovirga]|uniref:Exodeoxyribonuclease VII small subunit n=1 Tax=Flammeovirga agarivorans TaxID=2726742 RepID=A0A7X8SLT2_9BACT|nr:MULTISPECIES: exodeoxyribonuclease VII small subunit [Flammeovirga]NLR92565.1 exodeoxyribonuclease VII small subunit [Flammeovirga agarivorans]
MSEQKENITYEAALQELQEIQNKLDGDEVPIDDLSKLAKRAKELVKMCKEKLGTIESELTDIFSEDKE